MCAEGEDTEEENAIAATNEAKKTASTGFVYWGIGNESNDCSNPLELFWNLFFGLFKSLR